MELRLEKVYKYYEKDRIRINVLKDINFTFNNGLYVLTGPKYSGKTELLKIIGLLEPPSTGYIVIDDTIYKSKKDKDNIKKEYYSYINLIPEKKKFTLKKITSKFKSNYEIVKDKLKIELTKNPKIILIEDILDTLTRDKQKLIMKELKSISKDKIIIVTSKSNIIIKNTDKVINIEYGRII